MVNERSTGSRGRPRSGLNGTPTSAESMARSSSSNPVLASADTGNVGEPARAVSSSASSTSAVTSSSHSSSTRSVFVITTMPRSTRTRSRMARCSLVCGITPSSAATMSRARSIPPTPISMFLMNRSWPGTSHDADFKAARQVEPREAQLDGHAALFFRSQPIGIDACQCVDERGLAVVYVASRSDYIHGTIIPRRRSAIPLQGV